MCVSGGLPHVMSMPSLTALHAANAAAQVWPPPTQLQFAQLGMPANAAAGRGNMLAAAVPATYSEDGNLQGPRYGQCPPRRPSLFAASPYRNTSMGGSEAPPGTAAAASCGHLQLQDRQLSMPLGVMPGFSSSEGGGFAGGWAASPLLNVSAADVLNGMQFASANPPVRTSAGLPATPRWGGGSGGGLGPSAGMYSPMTVSDVGAVSPAAMAAACTLGDKRQLLVQLGAIAQDGSRGYKYRMSDNGGGGRSFLKRAATCSLPGTLTAQPPAAAATEAAAAAAVADSQGVVCPPGSSR
jgi:hypothetical protein